jgi:Cu-Zn family superoxide dismutase
MKKILILFTLGLLVSCSSNNTNESPKEIRAICQINSANGSSVYGEVKFLQINSKVIINVDVKGLSYGLHAIHIHEFGDCSSFDAKSAGGHWNPNKKKTW